jgi:hypothetical protein
MTGDELPYEALSKHLVDTFIGDRLDDALKVEEVIAELQKTYEPFFLIPDSQRRGACEDTWRGLLGDHVLCMHSPIDTCFVAAGAILLNEGTVPDLDAVIDTLKAAGLDGDRQGHVARALTPLAQLTGRMGSWTQRLMNAFKL